METSTGVGAPKFHRFGRFLVLEHDFIAYCSLLLALAGGWAEAPTFAHALPESFPLFRRHVLTALLHATAEIGATGTVQSKSAEEDPAQQQNPKRLPEGNWAPAEELRQQPIPQLQHYFAADDDK